MEAETEVGFAEEFAIGRGVEKNGLYFGVTPGLFRNGALERLAQGTAPGDDNAKPAGTILSVP